MEEEKLPVRLPFYAHLTLSLLSIILIIFILDEGRSIIIPLVFSVLIALMLLPLTKWLERRKFSRTLAAMASILTFIVFVGSVFYFLGAQIADFTKDLPHLGVRMQIWIQELQAWVAAHYHIDASRQLEYLNRGAADFARYASSLAQAVVLA